MTIASTLTAQLTAERDQAREAVASAIAAQEAGGSTTLDIRGMLRESQLKQGMLDELTAALA